MRILTSTPIENLVLAAPNRVQTGLPQSMLPNFVEEWKRPGKRTTWQQFFESLPPDYQNKARQDWYGYQKDIASRRKPAAPKTVPEVSNLGGPEGEQMSFPFTQTVTPQQFLARLNDGVKQFGRQFNQTTIRPYNNAIQHALRAIQNLSKMPDISPEIEQAGEELLNKFQEIQAGDAEDALLVQQLGQLAFQLGQSAGAYSSGAATNLQTRGPQQPPQQPQPNWWQRVLRRPGQAAAL